MGRRLLDETSCGARKELLAYVERLELHSIDASGHSSYALGHAACTEVHPRIIMYCFHIQVLLGVDSVSLE